MKPWPLGGVILRSLILPVPIHSSSSQKGPTAISNFGARLFHLPGAVRRTEANIAANQSRSCPVLGWSPCQEV